MEIHRGIGDPDPQRVGRQTGAQEEHRLARSSRLAAGTLACPRCDLPVALTGPASPAAPLGCAYCGHGGAVRDFLSLATPSRPARVEVRVVQPAVTRTAG